MHTPTQTQNTAPTISKSIRTLPLPAEAALADGLGVGTSDGRGVGAGAGTSVGSAVGKALGALVGIKVGAGDGMCVEGCGDGALRPSCSADLVVEAPPAARAAGPRAVLQRAAPITAPCRPVYLWLQHPSTVGGASTVRAVTARGRDLPADADRARRRPDPGKMRSADRRDDHGFSHRVQPIPPPSPPLSPMIALY